MILSLCPWIKMVQALQTFVNFNNIFWNEKTAFFIKNFALIVILVSGFMNGSSLDNHDKKKISKPFCAPLMIMFTGAYICH